MFDDLIRGVHEGRLYSEHEFKLLEIDSNNKTIEVLYQGAWFIVDNGYLDWSCAVPLMKHPISYEQIKFSEWIESMRKDIECTFGILKHRFAILKNGIRLGSIQQCDQVWLTCCALHNRLLFVDELDKGWDVVRSMHEKKNKKTNTPFAINRLTNHPSENNVASITDYSGNYFNQFSANGKRIVSKMLLKVFQERLIHHFDIKFKMNDIKWPQRKSKSNNNE